MRLSHTTFNNCRGSAAVLLASAVGVSMLILGTAVLSSGAATSRTQHKTTALSRGFLENEMALTHARLSQTPCPSNLLDANGRCLLSSNGQVKFWDADLGVGHKYCGSSVMGTAKSKNCIVEWDPCQLPSLPSKTVTQTFSFGEHLQVCEWGINGNLSDVGGNEFTRARFEDTPTPKSLEAIEGGPLPEKAYLCDIKFNFNIDNFHFADGVLLTFDDIILISSDNWTYRYPYQNNNGFLIYDWTKMRGTKVGIYEGPVGTSPHIPAEEGKFRNGYGQCPYVDGKAPLDCSTYCLGQLSADDPMSSICHFPRKTPTDSNPILGTFEFQIRNPGIFALLAKEARKQKRYDFQLITYGDNNSSDCKHGPLAFTANYTYVELP